MLGTGAIVFVVLVGETGRRDGGLPLVVVDVVVVVVGRDFGFALGFAVVAWLPVVVWMRSMYALCQYQQTVGDSVVRNGRRRVSWMDFLLVRAAYG